MEYNKWALVYFVWHFGQFSGSKQLSNNTNQTTSPLSTRHTKWELKKKTKTKIEEAQSKNYASVQQKKEITHRHGW